MAVEEGDSYSGKLKERLDSLLNTSDSDENRLESKNYCSRFCELVKEYTGRWRMPLSRLQVLRTALSSFSHGIVSFPCDCETVRYVLSSLSLSFFELLLFFGKEDFLKDPLRGILDTFQECHSHLVQHRNAYLLLVSKVIQGGGPWEHPVLQAILKESLQPHEEVEKYLSSECPIFFELRVRYLIACDRVQEAIALAKCCVAHPEVGKHLYFHQAYLTCLLKASYYDHLYKGIAMIDGRDAVDIICNSETEEKDELLLVLCKAFLTHQLQTGDMYYLWDLIFIWSKLHLRLDPSKKKFLGECQELMMKATNVRSIFPFIKVIKAELGSEGLEFCVELCARALQMDLRHDPVTASLIYKTIAYLLPNDLEVCRACALLVFFQERTVESYKTVYLLYLHPDQEYHVDSSVIKNHMRFEILQILKRGLCFDPEFWNLITLRTNCLKLMSEKVMKAALIEIMEEDKWVPKYYMKEPYELNYDASELYLKKVQRSVKCKHKPLTKLIVVPPEVTVASHVKKRGRKPGSRVIRVVDDSQLRQSQRLLDVAQDKTVRSYTRRNLPEVEKNNKNALKRRGRKPRWLLQQAAVEKGTLTQTEALGDRTLLPPMDIKKPMSTTAEMIDEMEKVVESSQAEAENGQFLYVAIGGIRREPDCVHEETLSVVPIQGDPLITQVHSAVLDFSLSDRNVTNAGSSEQEGDRPLLVSTPQQHCILKDTTRTLKMPTEAVHFEKVQESCEMEVDCPTQCVVDLERKRLFSVEKANICEESAIEVDIAIIHQLHNYCKVPEAAVGEDVQVLVTMPDKLTSVPLEKSSASTNSVEELSGNVCESSLPQKEMSPQQALVEAGISSTREFDIPKPGCAAAVLVEEAKIVENKIVQCEKTCKKPVEIIPDNIAQNPVTVNSLDDVKKSSETQAEVSQNTDRTSDNTVNHPENVTYVSEKINCVIGNSGSIPDDTAVALSSTSSATGTVSQMSSTPEHDVGTSVSIPEDTTVVPSRTESLIEASSATPEPAVGNSVNINDDNTHPLTDSMTQTLSSMPEADVGNSGFPDDTTSALCSTDSLTESTTSFTPEQPVVPLLHIPDDSAVVTSSTDKIADSLTQAPCSMPEKAARNSIGVSDETTIAIGSTDAVSDIVSQTPSSLTHDEVVVQPSSLSKADKTGCANPSEALLSSILPKTENYTLRHRCRLCNEELRGGNIMRHAITHLQKGKLKCIFCGTLFNRRLIAKKHVSEHIDKLKISSNNIPNVENRTESLRCVAGPLPPKGKHKKKAALGMQLRASSRKRKCRREQNHLNTSKSSNPENVGRLLRNGSVNRRVNNKKEYRCPADGCAKTFLRKGFLVIKHAVKSHPHDVKVQEYAFQWRKGKCEFCQRQFKNLQHFQDHTKRHEHPLKHVCYHHGCKERFKTHNELRKHMKSHQPLKAQCSFADCFQHFGQLSRLHNHEQKHYAPSKRKNMSSKIPPDDTRVQKEGKRKPLPDSCEPGHKTLEENTSAKIPLSCQDVKTVNENTAEGKNETAASEVHTEDTLLTEGTCVEGSTCAEQLVNGLGSHEDALLAVLAHVEAKAGNIQECNDGTRGGQNTKSEMNKSLEEHPTPEHKNVKSEGQNPYGRTSNKPFVRPPPTAYLDEKFISMPKRRMSLADSSSASQEHNSSTDVLQRQRCPKCFSSFSSVEALQSHLSSNKCTSLFGFDSDEESAS